MEQLRKLDRSVTRPGTIYSIIAGVLGSLIFGTGMSCVMVWGETLMVAGIIIGISGLILIVSAYPLYAIITNKQKEKIGPQILALADELNQ